ncbi:MAG: hypothetical protein V3T53_13505, partial [Phycisphaerales bacterium]
MRTHCLFAAFAGLGLCAHACAQAPRGDAEQNPNWQAAEAGILANQVQLTFADQFVKAGESYFSPDDSKVIFQAVELPPAG